MESVIAYACGCGVEGGVVLQAFLFHLPTLCLPSSARILPVRNLRMCTHAASFLILSSFSAIILSASSFCAATSCVVGKPIAQNPGGVGARAH
jgi:hypothetical protein